LSPAAPLGAVRRSSSTDAAGVSWYVMPDIHVTQGHREYMGFFHAMAPHPHGEFEESNVAGLFIVGDASDDVQLAIVAAAKGARAAVAINKAILREARLI
jgi:thioredoxin reductase